MKLGIWILAVVLTSFVLATDASAATGGAGQGTGGNIAWSCFTLKSKSPPSDVWKDTGCLAWSPNASLYHLFVSVELDNAWIWCFNSSETGGTDTTIYDTTPYDDYSTMAFAPVVIHNQAEYKWPQDDIGYVHAEWSFNSSLTPMYDGAVGGYTNSDMVCYDYYQ